jgi:hypothetical protein
VEAGVLDMGDGLQILYPIIVPAAVDMVQFEIIG